MCFPLALATCDAGLFVAVKRLSKDNGPVPAAQVSGARGRKQTKDMKGKSESYVTARAIEAHGNMQMSHDLQVTREHCQDKPTDVRTLCSIVHRWAIVSMLARKWGMEP